MKKTFKIITFTLLITLSLNLIAFAADDFSAGKSAYTSGNYSLANQCFKRASLSNPSNSTIRYYLAQTYAKLGLYDQAKSEYNKIIQTKPSSLEAKYSQTALGQIKDYQSTRKSSNSSVNSSAMSNNSSSSPDDSYITKVTDDGKIIRWQTELMPIKVYINPSPKDAAGFNPSMIPIVKKGVEKWSSASNGKVVFTYVNDPNLANIKIDWKGVFNKKLVGASAGTKYAAGSTSPDYKGDILEGMSMVLTPTDPNGRPHSPDSLEKTVTHEMGHALGIMGHSSNTNDMMYPVAQGPRSITKRDINTLTLLYSMNPDKSNFKNGIKPVQKKNTLNTKLLGNENKRMYKEKRSLQEELKVKPKSDNDHMNMGVYHSRNNNQDKAISEYKKAIYINPGNESAHQNLGLTYFQMGKDQEALDEFNKVKKINPSSPDVYLLSAVANFNLKKKPESADNLKKYLTLNPKGASDPTAQELMAKLNFKMSSK